MKGKEEENVIEEKGKEIDEAIDSNDVLSAEEIKKIKDSMQQADMDNIIDAMLMGEPITSTVGGKILLRLPTRLGHKNAMELFYEEGSAWTPEIPTIKNDYLIAAYLIKGYGFDHSEMPEKELYSQENIKARCETIAEKAILEARYAIIRNMAILEKKVSIALEVKNLLNF